MHNSIETVLGAGWWRKALLLMAIAFGFAVPAVGQRQSLGMLDQIEGGRWELRLRDARAPMEVICLHDGRKLIQLQHRAANCERLIVSDNPMEVTVQYTCRGRGYGRTHIRRETGKLVQIETQGLANGLPFDISIEGRRVGECAI